MDLPTKERGEIVSVSGSNHTTRRDFLKSTALTAASGLVPPMFGRTNPAISQETNAEKLAKGWEYFQGSLGGAWDVWRTDMQENTVWKQIDLPHCFNAYDAVDPDRPFYEGPGWYRRLVALRNPFENGRTLVLFEGAGQKCEVFVSTQPVGLHVGGYDEFCVDITDAAATFSRITAVGREVPLAVLCDNSRNLQSIPSELNDFNRFGGLYRDVSLIYVPAISLATVHVDVDSSGATPARVSIRASLRNPLQLHDQVLLQIRIFDPQGNIIRKVERSLSPWDGEKEIGLFTLESPLLWSPRLPNLYRYEVQMASAQGNMSVTEHFGCRYFEFMDKGPFKLNGEHLILKGTQREEDHAGLGPAMPEDLVRRELTMIKEMGANFLGLGHHQQSRAVLDLCDEMGLLVIEAIPWSRGGLGGNDYRQCARNMLSAMIDQHYNHPSIILWGIGNENDWAGDFADFDKEAIRGFVKELNDLAHKSDPRRKTFLRRCDFCKDLIDVYSPSLWAGWYHGPYTGYREKIEKERASVPHFLHVEWGAESHAGRHSEEVDTLLAKFVSAGFEEKDREHLLNGGEVMVSRDGDWSETYACNLFDWHLKELEGLPQLPGSAQWIFKDFSTPLRPNNPIPHVNQKGLMERDLTPKEGYYVFQSYWAERPMVHIYGHSWPVRWGKAHELKLVKVYSNCETTELFVNGASQGIRKRNRQDFPAAGLHWLVEFQPGLNRLKAVASRREGNVEDEITLQYQTELWGAPHRLALRVIGREANKVKVEARLLDVRGMQCLDSRDRIRFGVTGDAALIDNLGTTTGSRSVELTNGRAEISLMTAGTASVVSAHTQSVPTALLTM